MKVFSPVKHITHSNCLIFLSVSSSNTRVRGSVGFSGIDGGIKRLKICRSHVVSYL
jgi:hypothetical protein